MKQNDRQIRRITLEGKGLTPFPKGKFVEGGAKDFVTVLRLFMKYPDKERGL